MNAMKKSYSVTLLITALSLAVMSCGGDSDKKKSSSAKNKINNNYLCNGNAFNDQYNMYQPGYYSPWSTGQNPYASYGQMGQIGPNGQLIVKNLNYQTMYEGPYVNQGKFATYNNGNCSVGLDHWTFPYYGTGSSYYSSPVFYNPWAYNPFYSYYAYPFYDGFYYTFGAGFQYSNISSYYWNGFTYVYFH